MNWNVITRDSSPYQGKSRVYISYYEKDRAAVAKKISDMFLAHRNCAVFYSDAELEKTNPSQKNDALRQVQCVVFPVFSDRISLLAKAEEDLRLCETEHIPTIPIRMDGMESADFYREYQKVFGSLQLLMPFINDPTKIPFDEQLKQRLDSIFTDDSESYGVYQREGYFQKEIDQKIKAAFRGSIFISYRKSDRELVRDLIKHIHGDSALTDIMIWYDEYLTLGEDYNVELRERITDCDVFIILGTAASLVEGNYILTDEYPRACALGKKIILICTDASVDTQCRLCFSKADLVIREDGQRLLPEILKDIFQKKTGAMNDRPEERAYFLGKAYLEGKLTQMDRELGVHLIRWAANRSFRPAMQLMAHLYHVGVGVETDPDQRLRWLSRAEAAAAGQENQPAHNTRSLHDAVMLNCEQGDLYLRQMRMDQALECYKKMLQVALKMREHDQGVINHATYHILALNKIANTYMYQNNLAQARAYLKEALRVHDTLPENTVRMGGDLDHAESLMMLANLERDVKNYTEAIRLYKQSLAVAETASAISHFARAYSMRCDIMDSMGVVKMAMGDTLGARQCFIDGLSLAQSYAAEFKEKQAVYFISCAYKRLGDLSKSAKDLAAAAEYYMNAAKHSREQYHSEKTQSAAVEMCTCCISAAKALYSLERYSQANTFLLDVEMLVNQAEQNKERLPVSAADLAEVFQLLGNIAYMAKKPARSRFYFKCALKYRELIFTKDNSTESMINLAAAHYKIMTANPYIDDQESMAIACELYGFLYRKLQIPQLGNLYQNALNQRKKSENRIAQNRSSVFRWASRLLEKADLLEQYGITCAEGRRNRDRITTDILEMIILLVDSDSQINSSLVNLLNRTLGLELSISDLNRYFFMINAFGKTTKETMAAKVPEGIRFLSAVEGKMAKQVDYHDGVTYEMRIVMYVIGNWAVELINGTQDQLNRLNTYIDTIDLYIEEQQ